jgi:hypothetical protein
MDWYMTLIHPRISSLLIECAGQVCVLVYATGLDASDGDAGCRSLHRWHRRIPRRLAHDQLGRRSLKSRAEKRTRSKTATGGNWGVLPSRSLIQARGYKQKYRWSIGGLVYRR